MEDLLRKVERMNVDGTWSPIEFKDIKEGDLFKLFGGVGDIEHGQTIYAAKTDAFPAPIDECPENYGVDCEEVENVWRTRSGTTEQ